MNDGFTLYVILETEGKISRKCGAMITQNDEIIFGTIGGGNLERGAIEKAHSIEHFEVVKLFSCSGGSAHIAIFKDLDHELVQEIMDESKPYSLLIEDNTVKVIESKSGIHGEQVYKKGDCYIHAIRPKKNLIIVGGGHVGRRVKKMATFMGYSVTLYDTRAEGLNRVDEFHIESYKELVPIIQDDMDTALVILTRGIEKPIVRALSDKKLFYIGMLGHEDYNSYYSPIGLDIGAENVKEVALSIISELEAVYHNEHGGHLKDKKGKYILVRGAGDLATGVIITLKKAGFRVIATEIERPTVIRRTVAFADAVYDGECTVEDVKAEKAENLKDVLSILDHGNVPVLVDPNLNILNDIHFEVVIDAIIAKKNLGTNRSMAPFTVALGPGFCAGKDCDVVVETKRGHDLARLIYSGFATPNTGIPGLIEGYGKERVIHSLSSGVFKGCVEIGTIVKKGDLIAMVEDTPHYATLDGMVRGMLRTGLKVPEGFKVADIDPRGERANFKTVSDKARALGSSVLLAVMEHFASC